MSYTPPDGNLIELKSLAGSYSPPVGNGIELKPNPEGLISVGAATVSFVGVAATLRSVAFAGTSLFKGEISYRDVSFGGSATSQFVYPYRHPTFAGSTALAWVSNSVTYAAFTATGTSTSPSWTGTAPVSGLFYQFCDASVSFVSPPMQQGVLSISCGGNFTAYAATDNVASFLGTSSARFKKQLPCSFNLYCKGYFAAMPLLPGRMRSIGTSKFTALSFNPVFAARGETTAGFVPNINGVAPFRGTTICSFEAKREHVFWSRNYTRIKFDAKEKKSVFRIRAPSNAVFMARRDSVFWMRGYTRARMRA